MPTYQGLQSILDAALGGYKDKGFRLVEDSDDFIILYHNNNRVAIWNQTGLTLMSLHRTCDMYLERLGEDERD